MSFKHHRKGACFENRRTGYSVPGVQIFFFPPKSKALAKALRKK